MLTSSHPGPIPHLRPVFVGHYYVQPATEYNTRDGWTTKVVRGLWQVRRRDTNALEVETDTKADAIASARELEGGA